jgi:hypothetical protein
MSIPFSVEQEFRTDGGIMPSLELATSRYGNYIPIIAKKSIAKLTLFDEQVRKRLLLAIPRQHPILRSAFPRAVAVCLR